MDAAINKKSLSEADIKRMFVDPAIHAKWDRTGQVRMEEYFTSGQIMISGKTTRRCEGKRADYILYYRENLPLAVVEAKTNNHTVDGGIQQAVEYAEILDIPFAYSTNGDAFFERDIKNGAEREIALADFPSPEELWERHKKNNSISAADEKILTEPYHYQVNDKKPRYYQRVAINRAVDAARSGQKRILLAMATGTGKTWTAFQIAWRLWKAGLKKKILYLADRNFLVDQAMKQDFKPFQKVYHKIANRTLDSSYELYFSLYHQLAGVDGNEPFRDFKPEFFDLVLIDECHRGSAKEESSWRKILEYFSSATHIGMTATPKETRSISSSDYFGKPIYVYSLRQGIADGFLAPYKVVRTVLDRDANGWRPEAGKLDKFGAPVEDRHYNINDFDRNLVIDERTDLVAEKITEFMKQNDRFAKTIVFCEDVEHASRMRAALVRHNQDMVRENSRYIAKITHDEHGKERDLQDFTDVKSRYPVIVTTSELLSTGVDCKTCKLIVLDKNITSDIEFKQIIGRGTRLRPDCGKEYFTIMDFRGVTRLFANDDFWIVPEQEENFKPEKDAKKAVKNDESGGREKIYVNDVAVTVLNERVQYFGLDGKLITESLVDYSRRNILGEYARLDEFLAAWNSGLDKSEILEELRKRGVFIEALREEIGAADMDDFDLICHVAWDRKPLSRSERAGKVKARGYLDKYEGLAREVLAALLDKYAQFGIGELKDVNVLSIEPFLSLGGGLKISKAFGGKGKFLQALDELQKELYAA